MPLLDDDTMPPILPPLMSRFDIISLPHAMTASAFTRCRRRILLMLPLRDGYADIAFAGRR